MKKIILWLLLASVMLAVIACEIQEPSNGTVDNMVNSKETDKKEDTEKSELTSRESVFVTEAETETETETLDTEFEYNEHWVEQFDYDIFRFQSPERLSLALKNDKKGFDIRPNLINSSDEYITLLNRFESGELTLKYPVVDGYDEDFLTRDISLFSSGSYSLPWIWYRCWFDDKILVVQVTYMEDDVFEYSQNHTLSQTLNYIVSPNQYFIESREHTITTSKGTMMVYFRDDPDETFDRAYLTYICDDMLIHIFGSKEDVYPELANKIEFIEVE